MVRIIRSNNLSAVTTAEEPRALSYFMSIEDVFMNESWSEDLVNNIDAYTKVALVRSCINLLAHFGTQKGFRTIIKPQNEEIKNYIDGVNAQVNMDDFIYKMIIKREIDGRAGGEIVTDGNGNVTSLIPLVGSKIKPKINEETFEVEKYEYVGAIDGGYDVEDILYFTLNSLKSDRLGISAIDAIKTVLKLKRNLEKDLLESSKRLWAPVGFFEMDTTGIVGSEAKKAAIDNFKAMIKPGQSVVHNSKVKETIIDLKPDINGLVRAIEKADEEIMGNWGIPKALLAREKTLTKSTLEFSLKALWEGPIASIQRYFRRELESQWYPRILEMRQKGLSERFKIKHIFNPIAVFDPQLIMSLAKAVDGGIITKEDFFNIVGWEPEIMGGMEPGNKPREPEPPEPKEE